MIRDPKKYCAALWDWDFLKPCFRETVIRVADLDGLLDDDGIIQKHGYVERYGHHLMFETTVPDREMTPGQMISHGQLVKVGFTIIYLWGPANVFPIRKVQIWREFEEQRRDASASVSKAALVKWVRKWFRWSSENHITPPLAKAFFDSPEIR